MNHACFVLVFMSMMGCSQAQHSTERGGSDIQSRSLSAVPSGKKILPGEINLTEWMKLDDARKLSLRNFAEFKADASWRPVLDKTGKPPSLVSNLQQCATHNQIYWRKDSRGAAFDHYGEIFEIHAPSKSNSNLVEFI